MEEDNVNFILFLLLVVSFFFLIIFFIVTLVLTYQKIKQLQVLEDYANVLKGSLAANTTTTNAPSDPTRVFRTLLLEVLPSKSANWERLLTGKNFQGSNLINGSAHQKGGKITGSVEEQEKEEENGTGHEDELGTVQGAVGSEVGLSKDRVSGCGSGQVVLEEEEEDEVVVVVVEKRVKKKKKKGKKKRVDLKGEECVLGEENGGGRENLEPGLGISEVGCVCPFTSMGSPTQRKIKELYDQLIQSSESNELTLAQVGEFTKCLAQVKVQLEDKAEAIKRKFSIKKALLSKADRSSMNRLCQQIYNLEKQQKRLEEDVCVYNWLQDQLQLSPACKKMFEVCADLEVKTKSSEALEGTETDEFSDISFEELLAQEKKDSFWQKDWKSRMCRR